MTKEIVKKEEASIVASSYEDDSDSGFEGASQADYSLGFLSITQDLTKTVKSGQYKQGMIYNTATSKAVDGEIGIGFIPVLRQRRYVEWASLKSGEGRIGDFGPEDPFVIDTIEKAEDEYNLELENGHTLVETFYMYGIVIDGDSFYEACIPFKGAMIRKYKGWMTELRGLKFEKSDGDKATYPFFAHRWRLTTIEQSNNAGDFHNWEVNFDGENAASCRLPADSFNYQLAKKLHTFLTSEGTTINFTKESGRETTDEM